MVFLGKANILTVISWNCVLENGANLSVNESQ